MYLQKSRGQDNFIIHKCSLNMVMHDNYTGLATSKSIQKVPNYIFVISLISFSYIVRYKIIIQLTNKLRKAKKYLGGIMPSSTQFITLNYAPVAFVAI